MLVFYLGFFITFFELFVEMIRIECGSGHFNDTLLKVSGVKNVALSQTRL